MSRSPYPENLDQQLFPHGQDFAFGHIVVVCGMAGNRSDFVAGWLASSGPANFGFLPWFVEPSWGKSLILPNWNLRMIDPRNHIDDDWNQRHIEFGDQFDQKYVKGAPVLVTKSHFTSRVWGDFVPDRHRDHMTFVDVLIGDDHRKEIWWQHLLKNCLYWLYRWSRQHHTSLEKVIYEQLFSAHKNSFPIVHDPLRDTLAFRDWLMSDPALPTECNISTGRTDMDVLKVDYGDLWHGAGPGALMEKFNMPVQARADWNLMAPLAKGPDRVWCLERWWEPW